MISVKRRSLATSVEGLVNAVDLQEHRRHPGVRGAPRQTGVLGGAVGQLVADLGLPRQRRAMPGPGEHCGGQRDGVVVAVASDRLTLAGVLKRAQCPRLASAADPGDEQGDVVVVDGMPQCCQEVASAATL